MLPKLGNIVQEYRLLRNLSLEDLAQLTKISQTSLLDIENNKIIPSTEQFESMATALSFSFEDTFFWKQVLLFKKEDNLDVCIVGSLLRNIRENKEISLREIANAIEIGVPYLCDIELGRAVPSYNEFDKICNCLQISKELRDDMEFAYFDKCVMESLKNVEKL